MKFLLPVRGDVGGVFPGWSVVEDRVFFRMMSVEETGFIVAAKNLGGGARN